jgi:2-polyprenyl-3-methyl-5-hydroxy-6-metoxy-1,4-benzoquinol methylase
MRNFDKEAQDNSRLYNYKFDGIFRMLMLEGFQEYIDKSKTATSLEIGSFDGSMTSQILEYVEFLHIIEPSQDMVSAVEAKFVDRVKTYHGTLEEFNSDQQFDNIFLIHTLEHLNDPIHALMKIKNMLTPNGRLFVAVPNANAISRQIGVHMGLIPFNTVVLENEFDQGHVRTYTLDTLRHDILQSGLQLQFLSGVFLKSLANFQLDKALELKIIDMEYIKAANSLAKIYPDFSASLIGVCKR